MTDSESSNNYPTVASIEDRGVGWFIDMLIALAVAVPVLIYFGVFDDNSSVELGVKDIFLAFVYSFVAFALIHGYFLAKSGQTIGKKIVGTRIVRFEDNERMSLPKLLFVRYLSMMLMSFVTLLQLIDYAFVFGERRQCLHDKFAGAHVINVNESMS